MSLKYRNHSACFGAKSLSPASVGGLLRKRWEELAIFSVEGKGLPTVKLAKNYRPKQGEDVVVIGSPLGLETTVSDGIVSSVREKEGKRKSTQNSESWTLCVRLLA
jgi:S1-C subfamily serine protease